MKKGHPGPTEDNPLDNFHDQVLEFRVYCHVKAKVAVAGISVATLGVAASFSLVAKGGALMALIKGVTIGVALVWRMEAVTPMLQVAGIISGDH